MDYDKMDVSPPAYSPQENLPPIQFLQPKLELPDVQPEPQGFPAAENLPPQALKKFLRDQNAPRQCAVCGDPTQCYHYDVPSCNGCKTFFRRTVILGRSYICAFDGKCPPENLRRCRACRFDRCILCGMNPQAIKLPENVDKRRLSYELASRRKALVDGTVKPSISPPLSLNDNMEFAWIDSLLYAETKSVMLRESGYDPTTSYKECLKTILKSENMLGSADNIYCRLKIKHEDSVDYESIIFGKFRNWLGIDLFLTLETAKTLPVMNKLTVEDRVTLLLEALLPATVLFRAFYSVSQGSGTMIMPDGTMPITFKGCKTDLEYEIFCRVLEPIYRVQLTSQEYVLLKALILCSADNTTVSEDGQAVLVAERLSYARTMLNLMQRNYGESEGAKRYAEVISFIGTYYRFAQRYRDHCMLVAMQFKGPCYFQLIDNIIRGMMVESHTIYEEL